MLKKNDIVKILGGLDFPKSEYWIVAGTAMVMHGVKEETKDVDLGCTTKLFEQLMPGKEVRITPHGRRTFSVNDQVEVFENWNVDEIEMIDGFPVASLESIKKLKREVGREKDLEDIKKIDGFIKKKIIKYFRLNILEAYSAYKAWKMLFFSKSVSVLPKEMAEKYVEIQNYHNIFFVVVERALLVDFVIMIRHSFDKRLDSFSLYKIDKEKAAEFVKKNSDIIQALENVRSKIFAHRDISVDNIMPELPAISKLDDFFENIAKVYNELSKEIENSHTFFDEANNLKFDIENLFANLYRGESMRKVEIDTEYLFKNNNEKASNIL